MRKKKISLVTLGCPKNLTDSEVLAGGLRSAAVEFVDDPEEAEAIIINTCGFIDAAKQESIDAILSAVKLKQQGRCDQVFVTGCLSQRYGRELAAEIPEVDGFYGNRDLRRIVRDLAHRLDLRTEILGERELLSPRHYAYLKISEGCEHPCTFCAIPGIRGPFQSRPMEDLLAEAERLAQMGVKELILIAQDTTQYGEDLYGDKRLVPLLDRLASIQGIEWIRILYTYPANFTDDLADLIAERPTICNYLDLPIQHISDRLLKRMARRADRAGIERIIDTLRSRVSEIALRTTLIVGFPGETEEDFVELVDFVEQVRFEHLGVFTYSREEGTPSYNFPDQVPEKVKRERWQVLTDLQNEIVEQRNASLVGRALRVLGDGLDEELGVALGRTCWDCPEIDGVVQLDKAVPAGNFCQIQVVEYVGRDLVGRVVEDESHVPYHVGV